MKAIKVIELLLIVAILGGLACLFSWLLTLAWNIVMVAALSIAVPLTFLTTLKGVGILCGIVILVNIIRSVIQKAQIQAAMRIVQKFDEEMNSKQTQQSDDDILRYFRQN